MTISKQKLVNLYSRGREFVKAPIDDWKIKQASIQFLDLPELNTPFFMIGVSGALHIMELSLRYVPTTVDLVLILNGMEKWEQEWAKQHFTSKAVITIDSNQPLSHNKVLDMLFDCYPKPFGILDYDCFVLNPACFTKMQSISAPYLLNALFESKKVDVNRRIPRTFILFFNTPIINALKRKYQVDSKLIPDFQSLSSNVVHQLAKIGIDKDHYPEPQKDFFDALMLIICMGYSEGFVCNFLDEYSTGPLPDSAAFHVGNVVNPNIFASWYQMRGTYFWYRVLEANEHEEIKRRYHEKFGFRKANDIYNNNPEWKETTGKQFFDFVESLVHKKSPPFNSTGR